MNAGAFTILCNCMYLYLSVSLFMCVHVYMCVYVHICGVSVCLCVLRVYTCVFWFLHGCK